MARQKRNPYSKRSSAPADLVQSTAPTQASVSNEAKWWRRVLPFVCAAIGLLLVYLPALNGQYVWDDDAWTSKLEPLFKAGISGLGRIWMGDPLLQQYYPLSATTFWIDWHLWHDWTLPMHVENVLLHGLAACLLGKFLQRLELSGAWLAAAVFAFHPVMVESVAWITERKNVLSLVLALGAANAYASYSGNWKPGADQQKKRGYLYVLSLSLCLAALLAKVTAFVLPPAFLLIAWWRQGTLKWRRDVLPTSPFFVMSVGLGLVVWLLEKHHVGAEGVDFSTPFLERLVSAGRVCWFYPQKLLWPQKLCFIYPDWRSSPVSWWQWAWLLGLVLSVAWMAWRSLIQKRSRGLLVAVLFYLGALVPVMGVMNIYGGLFSPVWDHWAYVPSLGVIVPACEALTQVLLRLSKTTVRSLIMVGLVGVLACLSWLQTGQYASKDMLWEETIRRNPRAWIALNNLGADLAERGRNEEAIALLERAIAVRPEYAKAHSNLASTKLKQGHLEEAMTLYRRAIGLDSRLAALARQSLGGALLMAGRVDEAFEQFHASLALDPSNQETMNNLAVAMLGRGQAEEARRLLSRALRVHPAYAAGWSNLGNALAALKQREDAVRCYRYALGLDPTLDDARKKLEQMAGSEHSSANTAVSPPELPDVEVSAQSGTSADDQVRRGMEQMAKGNANAAIGHFYAALDLRPHDMVASNQLADLLLQRGRAREAALLLDDVLRQEPQMPLALLNRAIAAFQLGEFDAAVWFNERSVGVAPESVGALNNYAWLLATCPKQEVRNGQRAVDLIRHAISVAGAPHPVLQRTLAAALAETGEYDAAAQAAEYGLEVAERAGQPMLVNALRDQAAKHRDRQPVRDSPPPQL